MDNEESVTEITAPGTKPAESAALQGGNNTAGSDRGQGKAPAARGISLSKLISSGPLGKKKRPGGLVHSFRCWPGQSRRHVPLRHACCVVMAFAGPIR